MQFVAPSPSTSIPAMHQRIGQISLDQMSPAELQQILRAEYTKFRHIIGLTDGQAFSSEGIKDEYFTVRSNLLYKINKMDQKINADSQQLRGTVHEVTEAEFSEKMNNYSQLKPGEKIKVFWQANPNFRVNLVYLPDHLKPVPVMPRKRSAAGELKRSAQPEPKEGSIVTHENYALGISLDLKAVHKADKRGNHIYVFEKDNSAPKMPRMMPPRPQSVQFTPLSQLKPHQIPQGPPNSGQHPTQRYRKLSDPHQFLQKGMRRQIQAQIPQQGSAFASQPGQQQAQLRVVQVRLAQRGSYQASHQRSSPQSEYVEEQPIQAMQRRFGNQGIYQTQQNHAQQMHVGYSQQYAQPRHQPAQNGSNVHISASPPPPLKKVCYYPGLDHQSVQPSPPQPAADEQIPEDEMDFDDIDPEQMAKSFFE